MPRKLQPGQKCVVYTYDFDSSTTQAIHESHGLLLEAPNWTPDGNSLVLNGDGRLWRMSPATGDVTEITMDGVPDINNDHVISPDGSVVYVSSDDGHIYAVPYEGDDLPRRVTGDKGPTFHHYLHGISPDGTTLSYIGLRVVSPGLTRTNVHLLDLLTQEDRQLTDDEHADDGAEFSPDGQWIYFNSDRGSEVPHHSQLFRMPVAGGPAEQLTDDERVNWFPHPSPNGREIAYVSFPPGTVGHPADLEVIVRVRDNHGEMREVMPLFGGQGTMNVSSWSPDGRAIAFVAYPIAEATGIH